MKRIYDFSRKPAKRNYTISDLQALKQKPKKLTMSNPANADEIQDCRDAGIDSLAMGMDQIDNVRAIAPTHFCRVGSRWAQLVRTKNFWPTRLRQCAEVEICIIH